MSILLSECSSSRCARLLTLPAELRLAIYEFALVQADPIPLVINHAFLEGKRDPESQSTPKPTNRANLALLQVSKQVREEALPVYFGQNSFTVPAVMGTAGMRALRPFKAHVRRLTLEFSSSGDLLDSLVAEELKSVVRDHLRRFRRLRELRLLFPHPPMFPAPYWGLRQGSEEMEDARDNLSCALEWLPEHAEVVTVGADFDDATKVKRGEDSEGLQKSWNAVARFIEKISLK